MPNSRRSRVLGGLSAVGVLVAGVLTAGPVQAQATSAGPYYATPSWDQTLPSSTRFIILSNFNSEAVLDRETGLVWERSPQTAAVVWNTARNTCANRTVGNRKGWRLPAFAELASLVDPSVPSPGPTLPPGHPFTNVQSAAYWSASTNAADPTLAWLVGFSSGSVANGDKAFTGLVWCVRGGMNADAY